MQRCSVSIPMQNARAYLQRKSEAASIRFLSGIDKLRGQVKLVGSAGGRNGGRRTCGTINGSFTWAAMMYALSASAYMLTGCSLDVNDINALQTADIPHRCCLLLLQQSCPSSAHAHTGSMLSAGQQIQEVS